MPVTAHIVLDARKHRLRKDGTYPVVLRVRRGRYRDFPVVLGNMAVTLTPEQWEKVHGIRPQKPWADLKRQLLAVEERAHDLIKSMPVFTFGDFADLWEDRSDRENVFDWMEKHIDKQTNAGTIRTYTAALDALRAFHPRGRLTFAELDARFLDRWRAHLGDESTAATYFAPLRAAVNLAIRAGAVHERFSPFTGYDMPRIASRAQEYFTLEQLRLIADTTPATARQEYARDLFLLSYFLFGMPPVDIRRLTWEQVNRQAGTITYRREKTKRKKGAAQVTIPVHPMAWAIIDRHGTRALSPGALVFPDYPANTNYYLRAFLKICGLPEYSMYAARHSFATQAMNSGFSAGVIGKAAVSLAKIYGR